MSSASRSSAPSASSPTGSICFRPRPRAAPPGPTQVLLSPSCRRPCPSWSPSSSAGSWRSSSAAPSPSTASAGGAASRSSSPASPGEWLGLSLLVLTLWKTGLLVFDARLLFGSDILRYGAAWLIGFLAVALLEEYLTRGYLQYTLTRGLAGFYRWAFKTRHSVVFGFWTAALIFSSIFGLGHHANADESPIGLLAAGLVGLVFCLSLWRTGSLWWAIGFHTSWDWAQSFLYGVPDSGTMTRFHLLATHPVGKPILSGGVTGPEGSIYILPVFSSSPSSSSLRCPAPAMAISNRSRNAKIPNSGILNSGIPNRRICQ